MHSGTPSCVQTLSNVLNCVVCRFETTQSSSVRQVVAQLRKAGGEREARLVTSLQRYAGHNVRKGDLWAGQGGVSRNITDKLFRGLKGVENVYSQHAPLLRQLLEDCVKAECQT